MNLQSFSERVSQILAIKAPVIWINTREETVAEQTLCKLAAKNGIKYVYRTSSAASEQLDPYTGKVVQIAAQQGGDMFDDSSFAYSPAYPAGLNNLFAGLRGAPDEVMVIVNLSPDFMRDADQQRLVYEIAEKERKVTEKYMPIVFLAGGVKVPDGILESTVSLELPLMTEKENAVMMAKWLQENNAKVENKETLLFAAQAATGLTLWQTRQAMKDSVIRYGKVIPEVISDVRIEMVKQCESLAFITPQKTLDSIGGHEKLKKWIADVKRCMSPKAAQMGVKTSKGYVSLGLAGTGKTAMAEAVANYFGVPLIIFDLSRVMGGLVGQSEQTARRTFEVIKSLGRCVVLIDEIDKQLGGAGNNCNTVSDGGTILRVFDVILQNLQDNSEQFYILTANDVEHLPSPLMRSGRIDKKWFFDFPNKEERKDIFNVYIKGSKLMSNAEVVEYAASLTEHRTGAEIEAIVDNAVRYAFLNDSPALTKDAILYGIEQISPVYETNRDEVENLLAYSRKNNIPKTSEDEIQKHKVKDARILDYIDEALERGA